MSWDKGSCPPGGLLLLPLLSFYFFSFKYSFIYVVGCVRSSLRHCNMQDIRLQHAGSFSCSMGHLVPWPGIEPRPLTPGAQSLSHWATSEVPASSSSSEATVSSPWLGSLRDGGSHLPLPMANLISSTSEGDEVGWPTSCFSDLHTPVLSFWLLGHPPPDLLPWSGRLCGEPRPAPL